MILIYMTTGQCIQLALAEEVRRDDQWLVCLDADGHRIAAFAQAAVAGIERASNKGSREEDIALPPSPKV